MHSCVFCDIVSGKRPAELLYENEHAIGILDIRPIHYGHSLIIPKRHYRDFLELPRESFPAILDAAHTVANALVRALKLDGFNIFSNNGAIAGQSVFHFHLHITPRYADDNIRFVLELKSYSDGQMRATADLIRHQLDPSTIAS